MLDLNWRLPSSRFNSQGLAPWWMTESFKRSFFLCKEPVKMELLGARWWKLIILPASEFVQPVVRSPCGNLCLLAASGSGAFERAALHKACLTSWRNIGVRHSKDYGFDVLKDQNKNIQKHHVCRRIWNDNNKSTIVKHSFGPGSLAESSLGRILAPSELTLLDPSVTFHRTS